MPSRDRPQIGMGITGVKGLDESAMTCGRSKPIATLKALGAVEDEI